MYKCPTTKLLASSALKLLGISGLLALNGKLLYIKNRGHPSLLLCQPRLCLRPCSTIPLHWANSLSRKTIFLINIRSNFYNLN